MIFAVSGHMPDRPETIFSEKETEQLTKLLEIELAQKRATWKQANNRARSVRAAGLMFLFFLIVGCLVGAYFALMYANERRANPPPTSATGR